MVAISKNLYKKTKKSKWVLDHRNKRVKYDTDLLDTKILIYEDMVQTWFLDVAKYLTLFVGRKFQIEKTEFDTNEAGFT